MSYDLYERSNEKAQPVALYEFQFGDTYWRYAASPNVVLADNNQPRGAFDPYGFDFDTFEIGASDAYAPLAISDDGVNQSGNENANEVTITCPSDLAVVRMFGVSPPNSMVIVRMRRWQAGLTDAPVVWVGTIASVQREGRSGAKIKCRSLSASFRRAGLRLTWTKNCPHALYDNQCRVRKEDYAFNTTVDSTGPVSVRASALATQPDGYFTGGFVEWVCTQTTDCVVMRRRAIESHTGDTLVLLSFVGNLPNGTPISVYPGCARTTAACATFNNLSNYGGYEFIPSKSPFDGDPIY